MIFKVLKGIFLSLICFAGLASVPEENKFELTYGAWSESPTKEGIRDVHLNYGGVIIDSCIQRNIDLKGKIVTSIKDCDYLSLNSDGFLHLHESAAVQSLGAYIKESFEDKFDILDNEIF